MKYAYKKIFKVKYNNNIFQVVIRPDKKYGFFKIVNDGNAEKFIYPTAYEFLHLSSYMNPNNRIKF